MSLIVEQHRQKITTLCQKCGVRRLELFGSAARGDFNPATSDLDFMVEFEDRGWKGLSDRYFGLLHGLEDIFATHVDLVDRGAVKNRLFLTIADQHRDTLYAA